MNNEELVEIYQSGNKNVLELIIEQNRGIVYKLANKFYVNKTNSIDIEDLEQEGFVGLMIAAEKYNSEMENKAQFITYATYWIYSKMNRFIRYKNTNNESSLNTPLGDNGNIELQDTLQDTENLYENVEEQLYIKQLRSELEGVMVEYNTLKEREVLKLLYGWDCMSCTCNYIGEVLGVTGTRVRQIESIALRKIRNSKWRRLKTREYQAERFLSINTDRVTERVVDRISFAEKYFNNIEREIRAHE